MSDETPMETDLKLRAHICRHCKAGVNFLHPQRGRRRMVQRDRRGGRDPRHSRARAVQLPSANAGAVERAHAARRNAIQSRQAMNNEDMKRLSEEIRAFVKARIGPIVNLYGPDRLVAAGDFGLRVLEVLDGPDFAALLARSIPVDDGAKCSTHGLPWPCMDDTGATCRRAARTPADTPKEKE